ncbi:MAG: hypothetical protein HDT27_04725 [Subdoligranulum sp.]|nr:hypothetical protein [Subdoligranulum sp.]
MTEHEKKIMQQEEQLLRDEASAHAARALKETDKVIKRAELHQYDLNQFAAVKLYHLQRMLAVTSEDPATEPVPILPENLSKILCVAIRACHLYSRKCSEAGDLVRAYDCCVAIRALKAILFSWGKAPAK